MPCGCARLNATPVALPGSRLYRRAEGHKGRIIKGRGPFAVQGWANGQVPTRLACNLSHRCGESAGQQNVFGHVLELRVPAEGHRQVQLFVDDFRHLVTPASPIAPSPYRKGGLMYTPLAPSAQARSTSWPLRMPPSMWTSIFAHRFHHARQGVDAAFGPVQLAATVVADDERIGTAFHRQAGIDVVLNAFDDELAAPAF